MGRLKSSQELDKTDEISMTLWYSVLQVVLYPLLGLIMRGIDMAVSYKKLFKLLIDRDMKKKDFKELTGISQGTLNKLQNGGNVMVDVLEKICLNMDCNVEDIMEIYPDPVDSTKKRTARSVQ